MDISEIKMHRISEVERLILDSLCNKERVLNDDGVLLCENFGVDGNRINFSIHYGIPNYLFLSHRLDEQRQDIINYLINMEEFKHLDLQIY